jgi:membrane-bound metal-dependent hydrolase YbcI (DUF457 family)
VSVKIPEHVTLSILLAQFAIQPEHGFGGTALMVAAGCLPDLDGAAVVAGWRFYRKYHRILGHGILVTLFGPLLLSLFGAAFFGLEALPALWFWLQLALLGHLVTDVCFYDWPVQLLWPFSRHGSAIGLLTWNDLVPTVLLYSTTAVALIWPRAAQAAAAAGIGGLAIYLLWRALRPRTREGWSGWVTGSWAARSAPFWRWLTGDFIS